MNPPSKLNLRLGLPMSETSVRERYAVGANERVDALCCPVEYDPQYLKAIPAEVIERDYGCGDPSKYVATGETVLDLGSGTGKICFIASQVVGPTGQVIGVDMTDDMLEVARRNAPVVAENIGHANVEFRKGRIQDLALNMELLDQHLTASPVNDANGFMELETKADQLRQEQPLIESDSIDVVVSNCVLNLVDKPSRHAMFREIYRVLKNGGRAVISDIVCDEIVPLELQQDSELWTGCISGAFLEQEFLQVFEDAGFHGVTMLKRDEMPWHTVAGIEFRSMTVVAYKGKEGPCMEHNQAVVYRGPFKSVLDDDGHEMERGHRYAVCAKTFDLYQKAPYAGMFEYIEPREAIDPQSAKVFDCNTTKLRDPRLMKGAEYRDTLHVVDDCCSPGSSADSCCS